MAATQIRPRRGPQKLVGGFSKSTAELLPRNLTAVGRAVHFPVPALVSWGPSTLAGDDVAGAPTSPSTPAVVWGQE